ncbi:peptide chain release factor N(5)-glutamine methyltransferase [Vagococcus carniphilus]|uniref:Release factor glutamine methyltransferase n=1 Tax=Vagococcus carniphilus TaxID=218144 RepID=A0A430AWC6_9ENTE|nr:peptide chain release factor N(5)-glutamine methyltransferase [Vagococcus carniphilus]QNN72191.1 peptide chain release factor N(5)-glutamine methyltransferase [Vagococcus carniphilus]RSU12364.1 protein-(glutamine-N5) methyltransferase, release factor-specific [Vagococcus carniphilus]
MTSLNTYFEVLKWASSFLEERNLEPTLAEYLILERKEWTKTDLLLNLKKEVPQEELTSFESDLNQIARHVPVQYLIGSCEFYGRRFLVNEHTLIPRPETEELVELILKENLNESKQIVDIGVGTGAISLSLKRERPNWHVMGFDISKEALEVARENAKKLKQEVTFLESDVLSGYHLSKKIDILVSNPPYISIDEWEEMDISVRENEPKEALFAEDNGLAIYKKIAKEARDYLAVDGKIYLEIGYLQGKAVAAIFQASFPEKEVQVIKDMNGQDRIIKVI